MGGPHGWLLCTEWAARLGSTQQRRCPSTQAGHSDPTFLLPARPKEQAVTRQSPSHGPIQQTPFLPLWLDIPSWLWGASQTYGPLR